MPPFPPRRGCFSSHRRARDTALSWHVALVSGRTASLATVAHARDKLRGNMPYYCYEFVHYFAKTRVHSRRARVVEEKERVTCGVVHHDVGDDRRSSILSEQRSDVGDTSVMNREN